MMADKIKASYITPIPGKMCESCSRPAGFTVEWPDGVQFEVCSDCLPICLPIIAPVGMTVRQMIPKEETVSGLDGE